MATAMDADSGGMIVKRVSVPVGLEELMEGLTKEVLRKKPKDIYQFASEYFARLLILREKGNYKAKPVKMVQSITKHITPKVSPRQFAVKPQPIRPTRQLSRQMSIRDQSPTKKMETAPITQTPTNNWRKRRSETRRSQNVPTIKESNSSLERDYKPKTGPGQKETANNNRDRSLTTSRRGRSTVKSIQSTPRQRSQSTTKKSKSSTDSTVAIVTENIRGKSAVKMENNENEQRSDQSKANSKAVGCAVLLPAVSGGAVSTANIKSTDPLGEAKNDASDQMSKDDVASKSVSNEEAIEAMSNQDTQQALKIDKGEHQTEDNEIKSELPKEKENLDSQIERHLNTNDVDKESIEVDSVEKSGSDKDKSESEDSVSVSKAVDADMMNNINKSEILKSYNESEDPVSKAVNAEMMNNINKSEILKSYDESQTTDVQLVSKTETNIGVDTLNKSKIDHESVDKTDKETPTHKKKHTHPDPEIVKEMSNLNIQKIDTKNKLTRDDEKSEVTEENRQLGSETNIEIDNLINNNKSEEAIDETSEDVQTNSEKSKIDHGSGDKTDREISTHKEKDTHPDPKVVKEIPNLDIQNIDTKNKLKRNDEKFDVTKENRKLGTETNIEIDNLVNKNKSEEATDATSKDVQMNNEESKIDHGSVDKTDNEISTHKEKDTHPDSEVINEISNFDKQKIETKNKLKRDDEKFEVTEENRKLGTEKNIEIDNLVNKNKLEEVTDGTSKDVQTNNEKSKIDHESVDKTDKKISTHKEKDTHMDPEAVKEISNLDKQKIDTKNKLNEKFEVTEKHRQLGTETNIEVDNLVNRNKSEGAPDNTSKNVQMNNEIKTHVEENEQQGKAAAETVEENNQKNQQSLKAELCIDKEQNETNDNRTMADVKETEKVDIENIKDILHHTRSIETHDKGHLNIKDENKQIVKSSDKKVKTDPVNHEHKAGLNSNGKSDKGDSEFKDTKTENIKGYGNMETENVDQNKTESVKSSDNSKKTDIENRAIVEDDIVDHKLEQPSDSKSTIEERNTSSISEAVENKGIEIKETEEKTESRPLSTTDAVEDTENLKNKNTTGLDNVDSKLKQESRNNSDNGSQDIRHMDTQSAANQDKLKIEPNAKKINGEKIDNQNKLENKEKRSKSEEKVTEKHYISANVTSDKFTEDILNNQLEATEKNITLLAQYQEKLPSTASDEQIKPVTENEVKSKREISAHIKNNKEEQHSVHKLQPSLKDIDSVSVDKLNNIMLSTIQTNEEGTTKVETQPVVQAEHIVTNTVDNVVTRVSHPGKAVHIEAYDLLNTKSHGSPTQIQKTFGDTENIITNEKKVVISKSGTISTENSKIENDNIKEINENIISRQINENGNKDIPDDSRKNLTDETNLLSAEKEGIEEAQKPDKKVENLEKTTVTSEPDKTDQHILQNTETSLYQETAVTQDSKNELLMPLKPEQALAKEDKIIDNEKYTDKIITDNGNLIPVVEENSSNGLIDRNQSAQGVKKTSLEENENVSSSRVNTTAQGNDVEHSILSEDLKVGKSSDYSLAAEDGSNLNHVLKKRYFDETDISLKENEPLTDADQIIQEENDKSTVHNIETTIKDGFDLVEKMASNGRHNAKKMSEGKDTKNYNKEATKSMGLGEAMIHKIDQTKEFLHAEKSKYVKHDEYADLTDASNNVIIGSKSRKESEVQHEQKKLAKLDLTSDNANIDSNEREIVNKGSFESNLEDQREVLKENTERITTQVESSSEKTSNAFTENKDAMKIHTINLLNHEKLNVFCASCKTIPLHDPEPENTSKISAQQEEIQSEALKTQKASSSANVDQEIKRDEPTMLTQIEATRIPEITKQEIHRFLDREKNNVFCATCKTIPLHDAVEESEFNTAVIERALAAIESHNQVKGNALVQMSKGKDVEPLKKHGTKINGVADIKDTKDTIKSRSLSNHKTKSRSQSQLILPLKNGSKEKKVERSKSVDLTTHEKILPVSRSRTAERNKTNIEKHKSQLKSFSPREQKTRSYLTDKSVKNGKKSSLNSINQDLASHDDINNELVTIDKKSENQSIQSRLKLTDINCEKSSQKDERILGEDTKKTDEKSKSESQSSNQGIKTFIDQNKIINKRSISLHTLSPPKNETELQAVKEEKQEIQKSTSLGEDNKIDLITLKDNSEADIKTASVASPKYETALQAAKERQEIQESTLLEGAKKIDMLTLEDKPKVDTVAASGEKPIKDVGSYTESHVNIFGNEVKKDRTTVEELKNIDVKEKQSALKIQALWRGYKVRKNIVEVKEKLKPLDDLLTEQSTNRKLTDADIMKAATIIQANIRGFLERKKYKAKRSPTQTLERIVEEPVNTPEKTGLNKLTVTDKVNSDHVHCPCIQDDKSLNNLINTKNLVLQYGKEQSSSNGELKSIDVKNDKTENSEDKQTSSLTDTANLTTNIKDKQITEVLVSDSSSKSDSAGTDKNILCEESEHFLKELDKIKIPTDDPLIANCGKPELHKSETVEEPEIIKKVYLPTTADSSGNDVKDDNNNSQDKDLTPLEQEVKHTIQNISQSEGKTRLEKEVGEAVKHIMADNIENIDTNTSKNTDIGSTKIAENADKPKAEKKATEDQKEGDIGFPKEFQTTEEKSETVTLNQPDKEKAAKDLKQENAKTLTEDAKNKDTLKNITHILEQQNENPNHEATCAGTEQKSEETKLAKDNDLTETKQNIQTERVLSKESQDPAENCETVTSNKPDTEDIKEESIKNLAQNTKNKNATNNLEEQHEKTGQKSEEIKLVNDDIKATKQQTLTGTNAFEDHVGLIDQVQNQILDHISGSSADPKKKFDIDLLRKELEEAAMIYKNEDDGYHGETDTNDELLDYLSDFEPEEESRNDSILNSIKELPAIEEEEIESKDSADNKESEEKTKLEPTESKENEKPFCRISDCSENKETKVVNGKELKDLVEVLDNDEAKSVFKGIDNKSVSEKLKTSETKKPQYIADSSITAFTNEGSLDRKAKPADLLSQEQGPLLHTSELHDSLAFIPTFQHFDEEDKNDEKQLLIDDEQRIKNGSTTFTVKDESHKQNLLSDDERSEKSSKASISETHREKKLSLISSENESKGSDGLNNLTSDEEAQSTDAASTTSAVTVVENENHLTQHAESAVSSEDIEHKKEEDRSTPGHEDKTIQTENLNPMAQTQSPAGVKVVTSRRPSSPCSTQTPNGVVGRAQNGVVAQQSESAMDGDRRRNNTFGTTNTAMTRNIEAEAATKIQAGFRGYQVRKQMRGTKDDNQKRSIRRKNSGINAGASCHCKGKGRQKNAPETELEEAAIKIQAGVRGFLVRKKQKKYAAS